MTGMQSASLDKPFKGMTGLAVLTLALYVVCAPFYIFPSGTPQPSDLVLCTAFAAFGAHCLYTSKFAIRAIYQPSLICVGLLVLYAWIVNLVWLALLGNLTLLVFPMFYLFNLLAFALVLSSQSMANLGTARVIVVACALGVVLQAGLSPFVTTTLTMAGERHVLFFNNPNQLAYYAVVSGTIIALGRERAVLSPALYVLGLLAVAWLVALSLSKAALVALFVLYSIEFVRGRVAVPVLVICGGAVALMAIFSEVTVIDRVFTRLGSIGQDADDSVAGRGYDRIWNYPWYIVLGAGEGETSRFALLAAGSRELHSTLGTLLFSYGIPASFLFFCMGCLLLFQVRMKYLVYLLPPLLYGLTHNGLRETLVWILLALVIGCADVRRQPTFAFTPQRSY
jgi:hypothetical protein